MTRHRALAAVLALALLTVSCGGSSDSRQDDDLVAWCRAATSLVTSADVIGPEFDGDPSAAAVDLDRVLLDALDLAPEQLTADLARLRDLVVVFDEQLTLGLDREAARVAAWGETDAARVAASLTSLDLAISGDCGVSLTGSVGPPPGEE